MDASTNNVTDEDPKVNEEVPNPLELLAAAADTDEDPTVHEDVPNPLELLAAAADTDEDPKVNEDVPNALEQLAAAADTERRLFNLELEKQRLKTENQRLIDELQQLRRLNSKDAVPATNGNTGPDLSAVLNTLADVLHQQQVGLPKKEPEVYKGDVFTFPVWMNSFELLVESRYSSTADRLYYLGRYTAGDAKASIKGFLSLNTDNAYARAKERLQDRYGNKLLLAQSFRDKIEKWPVVKPGDGKGIRELSDFLCQCETAMSTLGHLRVLDDAEEHRKILAKLPKYMQTKWMDAVDKWTYGDDSADYQVKKDSYPPFAHLCRFVFKQARIACNPLFEKGVKGVPNVNTPHEKSGKVASGVNTNAQRRSFASNAELDTTATGSGSSQETRPSSVEGSTGSKVKCALCKDESQNSHLLLVCPKFKAMSLSDRVEFVKKSALCLGCLRWGHRKKECKHKHKCDKCQRLHPTLLHDDSYKPSNSSTGTTGNSGTGKVESNGTVESANAGTYCAECDEAGGPDCLSHSLIVPVLLHHEDDPQNSVVVYALLDEQSDACFITNSAREKLGVNGESVDLRLATVLAEEVIPCQRVSGLVVQGLSGQTSVALPGTYTRDEIPAKRSQIPRSETVKEWSHLDGIVDQLAPYLEVEIGLLIGINCSKAIRPLQIVPGGDCEPYGVKTVLGWGVVGMMGRTRAVSEDDEHRHQSLATSRFSFRTQVREVSPGQVASMFEQDFHETSNPNEAMSVDDRKFMTKVTQGIRRREDGHFEVPLPFREDVLKLPNNREMALTRLRQLKSKMLKNEKFREDYCGFMEKLIRTGQAELVPEDEIGLNDGTVWFIPHHAVYHPRKPTKVRVVFDCAAIHHGEALNHHLLKGPQKVNSLSGLLTRFRKERTAFTCDVEGMFLQVGVPAEHRNYLRFLWWPNGNLTEPPLEYRMTTHLFGATSSPGCASFALTSTAEMFAGDFDQGASTFIKRDFYVDDGLKSTSTEREAITLIRDTQKLCALGGFNLHKFICNSQEVKDAIPEVFTEMSVKCVDLHHDEMPVERTLGLVWNVHADTFQFKVDIKDKPQTRRGVLSIVSSVYDPLGLISPFILKGKQILKHLCKAGVDWDDPIPEEVRGDWEDWKSDLLNLPKLSIPRCYKSQNLGKVTSVELHHFSDSSFEGYGQCSYVRLNDDDGRSDTALVMAKSRVTPTKTITIPRLELQAAVTSTRVAQFLDRELDYDEVENYYYTDSKVVLGYVSNESRKFHIFVANRVQEIRDTTSPLHWRYISTDQNPADYASRGLSIEGLMDNSLWWKGPPFLMSGIIPPHEEHDVQGEDPELKIVHQVGAAVVDEDDMTERFQSFSTWSRLKKAIAICLKLRNKDRSAPIDTEAMQRAEKRIIKVVQRRAFHDEISSLKSTGKVGSKSNVFPLDPYLDEDDIVRVGGRLGRSSLPDGLKHPILLPQNDHVSRLIIGHFHAKTMHAGRGMTLNSIRQAGFWIVRARTAVASYIMKCIVCRKLRGTPCGQRMADLPLDRLEPAAPFTYAAVDYFGPFVIKEGRNELKRWGVLFSCLSSRGIHIETANQLSTDSFLNAYRRFVSRRGPVRLLRSDRGTNFVGGKNELSSALEEMDNDKIRQELLKLDCDWVDFKMNVPHASHMGGAWERMIGSARRVLTALLSQNGRQLDDELLRTLMAETEAIVNSRPLAVVDTKSADLEPLSPSQLLTLKSQVVKPLPGVFVKEDLYCRRRWRRVQFLANQFWTRWRAEYLTSLQPRKKWHEPMRNLQVDDVVLMIDGELPRNQWPLGRVVRVLPSEDGRVRKVELSARGKTYERPVHKLIMLIESSDDPKGAQ